MLDDCKISFYLKYQPVFSILENVLSFRIFGAPEIWRSGIRAPSITHYEKKFNIKIFKNSILFYNIRFVINNDN